MLNPSVLVLTAYFNQKLVVRVESRPHKTRLKPDLFPIHSKDKPLREIRIGGNLLHRLVVYLNAARGELLEVCFAKRKTIRKESNVRAPLSQQVHHPHSKSRIEAADNRDSTITHFIAIAIRAMENSLAPQLLYTGNIWQFIRNTRADQDMFSADFITFSSNSSPAQCAVFGRLKLGNSAFYVIAAESTKLALPLFQVLHRVHTVEPHNSVRMRAKPIARFAAIDDSNASQGCLAVGAYFVGA